MRFLSYIATEADDFEALGDKYFSLDEIANLLGSSHHQHRLYALEMLTKAVTSRENSAKVLFGTVLHPDCS